MLCFILIVDRLATIGHVYCGTLLNNYAESPGGHRYEWK